MIFPDGEYLSNSLVSIYLRYMVSPTVCTNQSANQNTHAQSEQQWYAMRVTYGREIVVKKELDKIGAETFVPMRDVVEIRGKRRIRRRIPAISNLLFIHATSAWMSAFKAATKLPIRYIMDPMTHEPLIVPEHQMTPFIKVAAHSDDAEVEFLPPSFSTAGRGTRVLVTEGIFAGTEGVFMRIRGDRRVVVSIPGIAAVATHFIHPSHLKILT